MAIKLQNPLVLNEQHIYPLTLDDQVITKDGSRLNTKYISVDINDTDSGIIPKTNAEQLGGISADNYATKAFVSSEIANAQLGGENNNVDLSGFMLKTDTAIDSQKLGGADANQYTLKSEFNDLINNLDFSAAQPADWDGNTLATQLPNGLTYTQGGLDAGFPSNYITCFAVKYNNDRCMQIAMIKGNAMTYVRAPLSNSADGWTEWKRIITANDTINQAANSNKLGGKAPKYYLPAVNLLDNSDFHIAQAGHGGMHGATRYAADRWYNLYGYGDFSFDEQKGLTVTYGPNHAYACQKFEDETLVGKPLTFAVCLSDGSIHVCSGVYTNTTATAIKEYNTWLFGIYEREVRIIVVSGSQTIRWAALYEGEYTAETLPPYVPKGYAAELAECQRYFLKPSLEYCFFYYLNYNKTAYFAGTMHFPIEMRIVPTVTILDVRISGVSESLNPSQFTFAHIHKSGIDTISFPYETELKQAIPLFALVEASADL